MEDEFIKGRSEAWRLHRAFDQKEWLRTHGKKAKPKHAKASKRKASKLPEGCIDILVEDPNAEEEEQVLDRERCVPCLLQYTAR
jgi:hypothetical protein